MKKLMLAAFFAALIGGGVGCRKAGRKDSRRKPEVDRQQG